MTGEFITAGHLGGYVSGGDPDCVYPKLWEWLVSDLDVRSMLDIGCGDGATVKWFEQHGVFAEGIDGVPIEMGNVYLCDFTQGTFNSGRTYDLGWSCEFVEHVEAEFEGNFLNTFKACRMLLMTHALPGQPGWHHVNCQDSAYWIERVEASGFEYDADLTKVTRELAGHGYYSRSGLAFLVAPE